MPYFNYSLHAPPAAGASFWERRTFVHAWWAIAREDERWTPPRYGALRRELDPRRNDHLARLEAALLRVEALYRTGVRRSRTDQQEIPLTSVLERPLAAAVALIDPRRAGRAAHLGLLQLADDALPEDMQALELARDIALWPGTRLTLQRVLLGTGVVGEKYQLTVRSRSDSAICWEILAIFLVPISQPRPMMPA